MRWLAILLVALSSRAGAEPILEFRSDLAFHAEAVEAFAERAYRRNLQGLESTGRLDRDAALLARIRRLLERLRIAASEERPDFRDLRWEVHTCRACSESASAMAGGKLLLGEEFVARLDPTDDELAFLLAHEMAHVLAEHTREFATAARYFVDNGLRREYWDIQRELNESLRVQFRMAFVSAQQELDADYVACFIGARAGFEPAAMLDLLTKLDPGAQTASPASHPAAEQRLRNVADMLQSARAVLLLAHPLP
jgi:predicted Zn-dependent protease